MITARPLSGFPLNSKIFDWSRITAFPTKLGKGRNFCASITRTLTRMECHAATLRAGKRAHEAHQQADEEMILINEGEFEVTVDHQVGRAATGVAIFSASMDLHGLHHKALNPPPTTDYASSRALRPPLNLAG